MFSKTNISRMSSGWAAPALLMFVQWNNEKDIPLACSISHSWDNHYNFQQNASIWIAIIISNRMLALHLLSKTTFQAFRLAGRVLLSLCFVSFC